MAAPASTDEILDVNRRYHDVAALDYDSKWGVDFGEVGRAQVLGKVEKLLGRRPGPFARSLEIGCGTGYFTLNLMQEGVIESGVCTDVSPGMLDALRANAERLGLEVETVACDAAALPFEDAGFDLVLGHAVLHHLPELERAFAEFVRVLRPGGVLLFAGEPSRNGDRIAALPKRAGLAAAPLWRRAVGAREAGGGDGAARRTTTRSSRWSTCTPSRPPSSSVTRAPRASPTCGCAARSCSRTCSAGSTARVEATAVHGDIPHGWFRYAYRGYILLQKLDSARARAAPAGGRLLQPDAHRAQALSRRSGPASTTSVSPSRPVRRARGFQAAEAVRIERRGVDERRLAGSRAGRSAGRSPVRARRRRPRGRSRARARGPRATARSRAGRRAATGAVRPTRRRPGAARAAGTAARRARRARR